MAGSIRQLGSGNWQVRFTHPTTGERLTAPHTFSRKAEAKDWLTNTLSDLNRERWHDPRSGRITLREWGTDWLASHSVRPATRAGYESDLRVHILPSLGSYPLSEITPERVRKWFGERTATGREAAAKRAYQTLATIMNTAVREGRIAKSPCILPNATQRGGESVRHALTPAEVRQVYDAMDDRYKALVLLAAFGGLRQGEAFALTVGDVNLSTGQVSVTKQLDHKGRTVAPKTQAATRSVVVPAIVLDALTEQIKTFTDGEHRSLLFTNLSGGALNKGNFRSRYWLPAVKVLDRPVTFHELRHTYASVAIRSGADAKVLQQAIGHTSTRMTFDLYGHLFDSSSEAVAKAMDKEIDWRTGDGTD